VDSEYLQSTLGLLEGRIAFLDGKWPEAVAMLSSSVFQEQDYFDSWVAFDAQIWCFWAARRIGADDVALQALSCAIDWRFRWWHEHPRVLEAASDWLAYREHEDTAALASPQADAIRAKSGIVRFPIDVPMNERTRAKLAKSSGAGWQAELRPKTPAIDGDDRLGWLVGALSVPVVGHSRAVVNQAGAKQRNLPRTITPA
jgi:hypothetical protein